MEHGAALDVVLGRLLVVAHLLAAKDQALLRRRDALLLLHSLLDARDGVVALDVDLNLLAGQRLDLDLRGAAAKPEVVRCVRARARLSGAGRSERQQPRSNGRASVRGVHAPAPGSRVAALVSRSTPSLAHDDASACTRAARPRLGRGELHAGGRAAPAHVHGCRSGEGSGGSDSDLPSRWHRAGERRGATAGRALGRQAGFAGAPELRPHGGRQQSSALGERHAAAAATAAARGTDGRSGGSGVRTGRSRASCLPKYGPRTWSGERGRSWPSGGTSTSQPRASPEASAARYSFAQRFLVADEGATGEATAAPQVLDR